LRIPSARNTHGTGARRASTPRPAARLTSRPGVNRAPSGRPLAGRKISRWVASRRNASTRLDPGHTRMPPRPPRRGAGSRSSNRERVMHVREIRHAHARTFLRMPAPRGANRSRSVDARKAARTNRCGVPRDQRQNSAIVGSSVTRVSAHRRWRNGRAMDHVKLDQAAPLRRRKLRHRPTRTSRTARSRPSSARRAPPTAAPCG